MNISKLFIDTYSNTTTIVKFSSQNKETHCSQLIRSFVPTLQCVYCVDQSHRMLSHFRFQIILALKTQHIRRTREFQSFPSFSHLNANEPVNDGTTPGQSNTTSRQIRVQPENSIVVRVQGMKFGCLFGKNNKARLIQRELRTRMSIR
jgi:hypothetical protein